jgi:hypothetical protein
MPDYYAEIAEKLYGPEYTRHQRAAVKYACLRLGHSNTEIKHPAQFMEHLGTIKKIIKGDWNE